MKRSARPIQRCIFTCVLMLAVFIGWHSSAGSAQASSPQRCRPQWREVSADGGAKIMYFYSVTAISTSDAWAVANWLDTSDSDTYIGVPEHFDGTAFRVDDYIEPGGGDTFLNSVAAVSATDVWSVGSYEPNFNGTSLTLIEHYNGTTWSMIPSPNVGTNSNTLNSVAVVSATDVWAVGSYQNSNNIGQTLIEHWNGTQWSIVTSPNVGTDVNVLNGVAAHSANGVWAVGYYNPGGQQLIERWDGTQWNIVSSPGPGALDAVTVLSSTNVWVVGGSLIEQWNGTAWNTFPNPGPGGLVSISAASASDIWAAGSEAGQDYKNPYVIHWDGMQWSVSYAPNPLLTHEVGFSGITSVPHSKEAIAVGTQYISDDEFYDPDAFLYSC